MNDKKLFVLVRVSISLIDKVTLEL